MEVMEKLFTVKQRFNPRTFGIEDVAYQKAFKYFLRDEANRRGVYLHTDKITATGKKEIRVRGLQPIMAVGRMYILPTQALLRNEMADFPLGEHDDLVDALSMHLQLWRGRMSPEYFAKLKEEEDKLLRRIYKGNSPVDPRHPRQDFDHDDMLDDNDRGNRPGNWRDSVVA